MRACARARKMVENLLAQGQTRLISRGIIVATLTIAMPISMRGQVIILSNCKSHNRASTDRGIVEFKQICAARAG